MPQNFNSLKIEIFYFSLQTPKMTRLVHHFQPHFAFSPTKMTNSPTHKSVCALTPRLKASMSHADLQTVHMQNMRKTEKTLKMSSSTLASLKLRGFKSLTPDPENHYKINVILQSNYGDPNVIRTSTIEVLNKHHMRLDISDIFIDPPKQSNNLQSLANTVMMKDRDEEFTCAFDGTPIQVVIYVKSNTVPTYMRIWNGREPTPQHVKHVKIYLNDQFVREEDVPIGFGKDFQICPLDFADVTPYVAPELKERSAKLIKDSFGLLPQYGTKTLFLDILPNEDDQDYFGINAVEIVDTKHTVLKFGEDIEMFTWDGCISLTPSINIFKENKEVTDEHLMWCAQRTSKIATLKFTFRRLVHLSSIFFYNHRVIPCESMHQVKYLRVRCGENTVWVGKLKTVEHATQSAMTNLTRITLADRARFILDRNSI